MRREKCLSLLGLTTCLIFSSATSAQGYGAGQVEKNANNYKQLGGWACDLRDTEYMPFVTIIRDDGQVIYHERTNLIREDAVRQACNDSETNVRGFHYSISIDKLLLIGPGNPNDWFFVRVYVTDENNFRKELNGSPQNMYFGNGNPTPDFDVNEYPPQGSSSPLAPSEKMPPYDVWPNDTPPTGMPYYPPTWPCQNTCALNEGVNHRFTPRLPVEGPAVDGGLSNIDQKMKDVIYERIVDQYKRLLSLDADFAEDYLESQMGMEDVQ